MSLPATLPEKFDASIPLSDERYERFARLRVMGLPAKVAALEAGLPATYRNAPRYDRHVEIMARKAYLAKDDEQVIAATRLVVREQLLASATLDVLANFAILGTIEVVGKKVPRVIGIDWKKLVASGQSAAITKFRFDPDSGVLTDFDRDDRMQALSQLRDMYGFRSPRRTELTGKGGGPIQTIDVTKLSYDDLIQFERLLEIASPGSGAAAGEGGDRAPADAESGAAEAAGPSLDLPANGR